MIRQPRVYCAGRIRKGDWRNHFDCTTDGGGRFVYDGSPAPRDDLVLGFTYAGPFFIACDHGCAHGPRSHGVGAHGSNCLEDYAMNRKTALSRALSAIDGADLVFVWCDLDFGEAYGTLAEIGYAHGTGKPIILGHRHVSNPMQSEQWFAAHMADATVRADDPITALDKAIATFKDLYRWA